MFPKYCKGFIGKLEPRVYAKRTAPLGASPGVGWLIFCIWFSLKDFCVSILVETCFYKLAFFYWGEKKFISKIADFLHCKTNIEGKLRNFMTSPGSVL